MVPKMDQDGGARTEPGEKLTLPAQDTRVDLVRGRGGVDQE